MVLTLCLSNALQIFSLVCILALLLVVFFLSEIFIFIVKMIDPVYKIYSIIFYRLKKHRRNTWKEFSKIDFKIVWGFFFYRCRIS